MNKIIRDSDGSLTEPSLHDSRLIRIDFGRQQLSMYFQCVDKLIFRLAVTNIVLMSGGRFAEENIVLDVVVTDGVDVKEDALIPLLSPKTDSQRQYAAAIKEQLSENKLKLLEVSPSFGGEVAILCESVEYEEVVKPYSI